MQRSSERNNTTKSTSQPMVRADPWFRVFKTKPRIIEMEMDCLHICSIAFMQRMLSFVLGRNNTSSVVFVETWRDSNIVRYVFIIQTKTKTNIIQAGSGFCWDMVRQGYRALCSHNSNSQPPPQQDIIHNTQRTSRQYRNALKSTVFDLYKWISSNRNGCFQFHVCLTANRS